jgi:hypothetical protein
MIVQALAQAAAPGQPSSHHSSSYWATTSRMVSSTQGPYSEYVDISRASAAPWIPITNNDWSEQSRHSSSSPSYTHDPNSPESGHFGEFPLSSSPPRSRGIVSLNQFPPTTDQRLAMLAGFRFLREQCQPRHACALLFPWVLRFLLFIVFFMVFNSLWGRGSGK